MTQTPADALRLVPDGLSGEAKAAHIAVQRDEAIRIAHRLHQTCESLIYGLPKYLEQTAQTDEENMIGKAWHTFDAATWQLASLPQPPATDPCFECGSVERIGTACAPCNPEIGVRGTADWFRAEAGRLGCDNWRGPQRLREAADRIAALEAAPASPLPGGVEALIAELKEAKRLMKPFATYYDINDLDERAADDTIEVPVGDLRLARAFLARNGKGEGK